MRTWTEQGFVAVIFRPIQKCNGDGFAARVLARPVAQN
jgi:hypothetical protein